jgi:hypothetical protein
MHATRAQLQRGTSGQQWRAYHAIGTADDGDRAEQAFVAVFGARFEEGGNLFLCDNGRVGN